MHTARQSQRTWLGLTIQILVLWQEYTLLFHLSDLPLLARGHQELAALQFLG
jgi:hypothetical protein